VQHIIRQCAADQAVGPQNNIAFHSQLPTSLEKSA
jgi:hypothetical protein